MKSQDQIWDQISSGYGSKTQRKNKENTKIIDVVTLKFNFDFKNVRVIILVIMIMKPCPGI